MDKLISACGIDCATCECRIATLADNDEMRQSVSEQWSQMYESPIGIQHINCQGCMQPGVKFAHCSECDIRACVTAKGLNNCAECSEYQCEKLSEFLVFVPKAKANLEELRGIS